MWRNLVSAPQCNINPASPPPSSRAPRLPSIPVAAGDLASLTAAVNALRQWVIQYLNQSPGAGGSNTTYITNPQTPGNPNNTNNSNNSNNSNNPNNPGGHGGGGNFIEVPASRITTTTRIYDPNDPTQETYIDVNQISGLEFNDPLGNTIIWRQNP